MSLRMVFIKHNSLKSDIFFNPIFIPCFSGSKFFRVQVFQDPGFSESRFLRVQVFQGPAFSESMFFRVRVQGPGPGFRSSPIFCRNIFSWMTSKAFQKYNRNISILLKCTSTDVFKLHTANLERSE